MSVCGGGVGRQYFGKDFNVGWVKKDLDRADAADESTVVCRHPPPLSHPPV